MREKQGVVEGDTDALYYAKRWSETACECNE